MKFSILLIILGLIKLFIEIDTLTFAFLYFLIKDRLFDLRKLVLFTFWAEFFSKSVFGLYIISFTLFYYFSKKQQKIFQSNTIFDFISFTFGYFFIRTIYNLPYFWEYKIQLGIFFKQLLLSYGFIIILFWSQYWLEKCLARFIKIS